MSMQLQEVTRIFGKKYLKILDLYKKKHNIRNLFPILLIGLCLYFTYQFSQDVEVREISILLQSADPKYLLILVVLIIFQNECSVQKWKMIMIRVGLSPSDRMTRTLVWKSVLTNLIIPTSWAGEIQKYYGLLSHHGQTSENRKCIILSQVLDKISNYIIWILSILLLGPVVLFKIKYLLNSKIIVFLVCLLSFSLFFLAFKSLKKIPKFNMIDVIVDFKVFFLSFVISFGVPIKLMISSWALGIDLDMGEFLIFMPVILLAYHLPIGGSAWGARELAMVLIAKYLYLSKAQSLSISILSGSVFMFASILGALIFLPNIERKNLNYLRIGYQLMPLCGFLYYLLSGQRIAFLGSGLAFLFARLQGKCSMLMVNSANFVTSCRLVIVGIVCCLDLNGNLIAGLLVLFLLLDGLDGFLARKFKTSSEWGALFDMEVDALATMISCILLVDYFKFPVWVLAIGLWRYAYAFWRSVYYPMIEDERRSSNGRWIFLFSFLSLLIGFMDEWFLAEPLLAISLLLVSGSFLEDIKFTINRAKSCATVHL